MNSLNKVLVVFGTRPEAIKLAPVIRALRRKKLVFDCRVCVTAQHREMLDDVLRVFRISPDYDLNVMHAGQTLAEVTSRSVEALDRVYEREKPDIVIVQGDTTTTFCGALTAFYRRIKVGHVEAGLRTWNKYSPFPEEINRVLTSRMTDIHFAPTKTAKNNLLREGVAKSRVHVTGNTVIDALLLAVEKIKAHPPTINGLAEPLQPGATAPDTPRVVLITGHRRENFGQGFENICRAIAELARRFPDVHFVYPVHLNPNVREPVGRILGQAAICNPQSVVLNQESAIRNSQSATARSAFAIPHSGLRDPQSKCSQSAIGNPHSAINNVHLVEPLPYVEFVAMMNRSSLLLTDSGGVQEEAPSLGKPVLVMRDTTERPEAVDAGTVRLVGTDRRRIIDNVSTLLTDEKAYNAMAKAANPYGDGKATGRILTACERFLDGHKRPV